MKNRPYRSVSEIVGSKELPQDREAQQNYDEAQIAVPHPQGEAKNPGEADKFLAAQMLLSELREVAYWAISGQRGRDYVPKQEERFWHLLGFSEGVVEAMAREADAPESFGSWAFYIECRLRHFRSVFVPQSAQQP